jgi:prophage antirepressor-like protein
VSNGFYLDVYNKILKFNDEEIFIVFDENDEIWFKYGDVLKVLGYIDVKNAIKDINLNEKYIIKFSNIKRMCSSSPLHPMTKMINNNGLFMLLSISTKPLAKQFVKQYIDEIMPTITKTGKYISSNEDMNKINELNKKISKLRNKVNNLKDENNFLDNKHRYHPSSNGYAYINQTSGIVKGKRQKSYKFGVTDDIESRIRPYKTGNPTFKMLYYIPLKIDMNQLETCIESIMMPHEVKKNNETVSFVSLKELKSTINNCAYMIANHACHCNYCKKQIKFNDIDIHNCDDIGKLTYIRPKSSKKRSKIAKTSKSSKSSKKGYKLAKTSKASKSSKKGYKLAKTSKTSKSSKKGSKLTKASKKTRA